MFDANLQSADTLTFMTCDFNLLNYTHAHQYMENDYEKIC